VRLAHGFVAVALVAGMVMVVAGGPGPGGGRPAGTTSSSTPAPTAPPSPPPSPRAQAPAPRAPVVVLDPRGPGDPSVADPSSTTVVVNKRRPLRPRTYAPDDLRVVRGTGHLMRAAAARAMRRLLVAAAHAHERLRVDSAYRSYAVQRDTYAQWVAELGEDDADVVSARPGYSEHQTGLAADLLPARGACQAFGCFAGTSQARWLAAHAHEYGFVVRYPRGAKAVTGYHHEPWHVRFVGLAVARRIAAAEAAAGEPVTLEEYFGLPDAPGYR